MSQKRNIVLGILVLLVFITDAYLIGYTLGYTRGKVKGTVHYVFLEQGATQSGEDPGHVIGFGCAQCSPEPIVKQHDGSCVFLHGWKDAQNNQRQTVVPTLCPEAK